MWNWLKWGGNGEPRGVRPSPPPAPASFTAQSLMQNLNVYTPHQYATMPPGEKAASLRGFEAGRQYEASILDVTIADAVKAERERCANIALALDSLRGNEKEIANAIRNP